MDAFGADEKYSSISQRVASTYRRMLTAYCPALPDGLTPVQQAELTVSQEHLHAFFTALYDALAAAPDGFGLPLGEDVSIVADHDKDGPNKTDLKRILDRPRKLIEDGLEFLRSAALDGQLDGDMLRIDPQAPSLGYLKKKPGRAWLQGLGSIGTALNEANGQYILTSTRFPRMMYALQLLSEACAGCENKALGRVFFARCDLCALRQDFHVDIPGLYRSFPPKDFASAVEMHAFFTARSYQPQITLERMFGWDVKYQGKRSVKSTPLFQVSFDERMLHPMHAQIKCASASRLLPLIPNQSQALQTDFHRRLFPCRDCSWCDNSKTLGPTEVVFQGQARKVCWYVNPDIETLDEATIALVKEYAALHEKLDA